jgi:hypothetical protein
MGRNPARGVWRLKPFIDKVGRPIASNFISVRPKAVHNYPLEYVWALCCSPLANFYVFSHTLKRNIQDGDLRAMPVPRIDSWRVNSVVDAAKAYLEAVAQYVSHSASSNEADRPLFRIIHGGNVDVRTLHSLLRKMDAEVLRLYDLPVYAERRLLDQFREAERPGVPGKFKGYFPDGFSEQVPLYAYLTDSYKSLKAGDGDGLSPSLNIRYEELVKARDAGHATPSQLLELHRLQAEIDGRDYATQPPNANWQDEEEKKRRDFKVTIGEVASRLASLMNNGTASNEN